MTPAVTLRAATAADEEFLHQVYASTREDELAPVPWTAEQKDAFLRMQTRAQRAHYAAAWPEAHYQVIELGGEPAGRLLVSERPGAMHMVDVAVTTAFRNRGIGTVVLQRLQERAAEQGVPLTMHTEFNNPARRLYARLGFQDVEQRDLHVLIRWVPGKTPPG